MRPDVSQKNQTRIYEISGFPISADFDDTLSKVLENYLLLEQFYKKHYKKGLKND